MLSFYKQQTYFSQIVSKKAKILVFSFSILPIQRKEHKKRVIESPMDLKWLLLLGNSTQSQ